MLVFGALMAFALLFNAMQLDIAERSVELSDATRRRIGHHELARLITAGTPGHPHRKSMTSNGDPKIGAALSGRVRAASMIS